VACIKEGCNSANRNLLLFEVLYYYKVAGSSSSCSTTHVRETDNDA